MAQDLRDPTVDWQVAFCGGAPIGYAKVSPLRAPAPASVAGALELQQLYIRSAWHGTGVAGCLVG